ncbi:MAG: hypothetical protein HY550_03245 [Elusimicrobia bacterium]|nr:hypothetical protein [Elusimicrobiota bacterium]
MNASERKTAARAGGRVLPAALGFIASLPAFFLVLLMVLALGTFLPPVGSLLNIFFSLLVSILLTVLFNRRLSDRGHGFVLGALALLGLVCGCLLWVVHGVWHARAEDVKRELDFSRYPVSLADFQEDLPESVYAFPRLTKVVENDFDPAFYEKAGHPDAGAAKWTAETAKKEAEYAAHYTPYLEKKLAPLLRQKFTRYMKVDYRQAALDPLKAPSPRLGHISMIARVARLCAISLAREGKTERAWELVRLQFALSDILADEKTLLEKMVALAIRSQGVDAAAGILLNRPGAVLPKDLLPRLREAGGGNLSAEGLRTELAYQFDLYEFIHKLDVRRFRELGGLSALAMSGSGEPGRLGAWLEYLLFSLVRGLGILDLNSIAAADYFSNIAEPGPWAQVSERNRRAETRVNSLPTWPYLLTKVSLPSFSRLQAREFEVQARARMTLVCSELLRYRREHGKYPARLSELKAGLLPDVFSGGNFIYEPAGGGFDLCSAGAAGDRKDNSAKDLCLGLRP